MISPGGKLELELKIVPVVLAVRVVLALRVVPAVRVVLAAPGSRKPKRTIRSGCRSRPRWRALSQQRRAWAVRVPLASRVFSAIRAAIVVRDGKPGVALLVGDAGELCR